MAATSVEPHIVQAGFSWEEAVTQADSLTLQDMKQAAADPGVLIQMIMPRVKEAAFLGLRTVLESHIVQAGFSWEEMHDMTF
jgi:hypothetical protein